MFNKIAICTAIAVSTVVCIGAFQLHAESVADAECTRTSSAMEFWLYKCPDGRGFYVEKSAKEMMAYDR